MRKSAAFLAGAALSAILIGAPAPGGTVAFAQDQSKQDLVRSLSRGKTRSLQVAPTEQRKTRSLVDSLRGKKTRQISLQERQELAKIVKQAELPAVDLEIYFAYDSAAISPEALPKLNTLGQALSDAELKGQTFMVAGHTDAKGSDAYNQSLSERRAESVRRFLIQNFGIDTANLIAIGYGEEQLKSPGSPEAGENRRVQIVNLTVTEDAPATQPKQ